MIVNWLQGVIHDRDKGVSGLSAEDADKLHDALFIDEQRIRFVPCGEGRLGMYGTIGRSLNLRPESAYNNDGITLQAVASGSDGPCESDCLTAGKQVGFRVITAEVYPHKKRRV